MQTRAYTCGPAALATVLQNMGINTTEEKLMILAGTNNKTGTAMYGLARAAQSKGLSAAGMELSVDDLKPNHIVHVVIDGTPHFSVIREITETSVKLSDPKLGNIEMTRERFSEIFTGNALVISNPNVYVNGTMNQTNQSAEDTDSSELEILASEDMQYIRGGVIKVLGVKLVALKAAITTAVKKLSLKELRRMGFEGLKQHIDKFIPRWLRWIGPIAAHAARGIIDYRDRTPDHKETPCGYAQAAVWGALWRLI